MEYIVHRNPPPPQLEYTSYHSWAALSIGWQFGTSFAASTSTRLSNCIQPAQAEDCMGTAFSYTGSLIVAHGVHTAKYVNRMLRECSVRKRKELKSLMVLSLSKLYQATVKNSVDWKFDGPWYRSAQ
jgi:hypothetical protein